MNARCFAFVSIIVSLSIFNVSHAQGIPVIDPASIVQLIEQIRLAQEQINQAKRQFESTSGTRNLGNILNNPQIRSALPSDIRGLLDNLEYQSTVLSGSVNSILAKTRAPVNYKTDRRELISRLQQINANVSALTQHAYTAQQRRLQQVDSLQAQINLAHDPKAISDLQARINIEMANIQIDKTKTDLALKSLEAEKELLKDRQEIVYDQPFSTETVKGELMPGVN